MFSKAIVRTPGKSMLNGITTSSLGKPDYEKAVIQHQAYTDVLKDCGLDVIVLEPDEDFPDSTFVEDTALFTPHCAIITNPGASSRNGETAKIKTIAGRFYEAVEEIQAPGTVDAGDIMMVGNHYYIGISARTNPAGARQMIAILKKYGLTGSTIELKKVLHLKTGLAYLENNTLLVSGEFTTMPEFEKFNTIQITESESYAANCVWINDTVLVPAGFPITKNMISSLGYKVADLQMSEFEKLDGGLSCLSLRF